MTFSTSLSWRPVFFTICIFLTQVEAQAQKKNSETLSDKDRIRFERLYIDASKSKILGDFEQAIKLYEACTKTDPNAPAPYYELGNLYRHIGQHESAIQNARKAADLDPDNFYYRFLYAGLLKNDQNFEKAAQEYEKIIADFPEKVAVYEELAMVYIVQKDYAKAIDVYNRLEKQIGPKEELKLKKQYMYLQTGDVDRAVQEVEELIKLQPDNIQYYLLVAELYSANKMDEKTLKAYERAEQRFPGNTMIYLSLADFHRTKQDYGKSLKYLKLAFSDPALDVDMKVKSIVSFLEITATQPQYAKDLEELGQILFETHPGDARVLTINGDICLYSNDTKKARYYFMKAVEIDNGRYPIWNQLLILEADLNMIDTLIIHSEQAVEIFPEQAALYYFLGYARSRKEQHLEAVESYERGLRLVADNGALKVQFYLSLGDSYNELGKFEQSDKAFESAIKMDSNNTVALNNFSYYLSLRGEKLEMALVMSAKSNKLEPNNATYLDTYAWIFYRLGRYEEARKTMEKAIIYGGEKSGVILEHMGDILFRLDLTEDALSYWERAKEIGGASALIDRKIKDRTIYE